MTVAEGAQERDELKREGLHANALPESSAEGVKSGAKGESRELGVGEIALDRFRERIEIGLGVRAGECQSARMASRPSIPLVAPRRP